MNKFITIKQNENLYFDKVLFETYIPILFICQNKQKELFICVCCQDNSQGKKWLISKIGSYEIVRMLKNEISIRDAFLSDPSVRVSASLTDGKLQIEYDNSDWCEESDFLPKKGAYIDADPGEYDEEILHYSSLSINYLSRNYKPKATLAISEKTYEIDESYMLEVLDTAIQNSFPNMLKSEIMQTITKIDNLYFKYENDMSISNDFYEKYKLLIDKSLKIENNTVEVKLNDKVKFLCEAA